MCIWREVLSQFLVSHLSALFWSVTFFLNLIHPLFKMKFSSFAAIVVVVLPTLVQAQLSGTVGPLTSTASKRTKVNKPHDESKLMAAWCNIEKLCYIV